VPSGPSATNAAKASWSRAVPKAFAMRLEIHRTSAFAAMRRKSEIRSIEPKSAQFHPLWWNFGAPDRIKLRTPMYLRFRFDSRRHIARGCVLVR
jgi:hypothetical protein